MNYKEHIIKWNKYYLKNKTSVSWWFNKPDLHVLDFITFHNLESNLQILDVWCWYWKNSSLFIGRWVNYIWIDIAKEAIEYSKKNINWWKFILWDIISYNFENKFDVIINAWCFHVNNKIDWEKILLKYKNLLSKNWVIFIRIFNSKIKNENPIFVIDNELPVWWYTKEELIEIFWKLFYIDKIILDNDYYEEDEIFYLYLKNKNDN